VKHARRWAAALYDGAFVICWWNGDFAPETSHTDPFAAPASDFFRDSSWLLYDFLISFRLI
jgi:hypothetical protein